LSREADARPGGGRAAHRDEPAPAARAGAGVRVPARVRARDRAQGRRGDAGLLWRAAEGLRLRRRRAALPAAEGVAGRVRARRGAAGAPRRRLIEYTGWWR